MSEPFNSEAVERLPVRLVLRDAQWGTMRTPSEHVRDAVLGFFGTINVALTLAIALNAVPYKEPDFQALDLRGAILPGEVAALFAEAEDEEGPRVALTFEYRLNCSMAATSSP